MLVDRSSCAFVNKVEFGMSAFFAEKRGTRVFGLDGPWTGHKAARSSGTT